MKGEQQVEKSRHKYLSIIALVLAAIGLLLTIASMATANQTLSKYLVDVATVNLVLMVIIVIIRWILISRSSK